jgi:GNAT superfamily N-acetyltransferase
MKIEEAEEALKCDMLTPNSSILVYEKSKKSYASPDTNLMREPIFVRELIVDERYRRHGIGKLLLSEVERIINEKERHLYLSIVPKNKTALRLFISSGCNILNTIELTKRVGKEGIERHKISLEKFRYGVLRKVFDVDSTNLDFDSLRSEKVVIDLSFLLGHGGTKDDVRLLMNVVLKNTFDRAVNYHLLK